MKNIKTYQEEAIQILLNESFTKYNPVYEGTNQKVDWTDFVEDAQLKDDGVYLPMVYKRTVDGYEGTEYERVITLQDYERVYMELLQEYAPEIYTEFVNVKTDKN